MTLTINKKQAVNVAFFLGVFAVVILTAEPAHASSFSLGFLEKVQELAEEITGPGAKYIGMIATVVFGFIAWFAPDGALKKWMAALCCLSLIFGATQVIDFFQESSGLVFKK